jgi:phosphatidylglycerol:prolipoprotein diacylglycerol transferase
MRQILFHFPVFGWPAYSFGLLMVVGFLAGIALARRRTAQVGLDPDVFSNIGLISLLGGIGGCRALYVIHFWPEFAATFRNDGFFAGVGHILNIRGGGLEFLGGLVVTTVALITYIAWARLPLGTLLDISVPSLAIGHAFGKIGCFLNGCCYGGVCSPDFVAAMRFPKTETVIETADPSGFGPVARTVISGSQPFADHVRAHGWLGHVPGVPQWSLPVHPTQLYEMAGDVVLCVLLTLAFRYRRRAGDVFLLYFLLYSAERFVLEFIRTEPRDVLGGLTTVHQLVAGLMFLAAAAAMVFARKWLPEVRYAEPEPSPAEPAGPVTAPAAGASAGASGGA